MYQQTLFAIIATSEPESSSSFISIWFPIAISFLSLIVATLALIKSNQATYLTRNPHIKMRVETKRIPSLIFRLIIENEGGRNGIIDSVDLGPILTEDLSFNNIFSHINGKELFPGKTISSDLDPYATKEFLKKFHEEHPNTPFVVNVTVNYHSEDGKTFKTPSSLNFSADLKTVKINRYFAFEDSKRLPEATKDKK